MGINFIDTANMYGNGESESHIGDALKGKRNEAIIATKFHLTNLAGESPRDRIMKNVEESLTRLQTDVIDLYQIHFIPHGMPHAEYLEPLNDLVTQGKVRYIGECNYSGWRHADGEPGSGGGWFGAVRIGAEQLQPHAPAGGDGASGVLHGATISASCRTSRSPEDG